MECDPALLELFRAEVETHMPVLSDGLLAMEKDASQTHRLKDLMRAAHSLKGAARLVGFEAAVHVAHALEDCFVAALDGRVQITSDHADVLLRGVNALQQLTKGDAAEAGDAGPGGPRWRGIVNDIAAILPQSFQVSATFDSAWVEDHRGSLARLLRSKCQEIRFDLAGCESIDAAGLALMAKVARAAESFRSGTSLTVVHASGSVGHLLHVTGLDRAYRLVDARA